MKHGSTYGEALTATPEISTVERVGQENNPTAVDPSYYYTIYRTFLAFDTSSIPDTGPIGKAIIHFWIKKNYLKYPYADVQYGTQPTWGPDLEIGDWGKGTTFAGNFKPPSTGNTGEVLISPDSINRIGRTEYELKGVNEGTSPIGLN